MNDDARQDDARQDDAGKDDEVPGGVGAAVAAFVRARGQEYPRGTPRGVSRTQRNADAAVVRRYEQAVAYRHELTAESLARTLLTVAARYADHPDYRLEWKAWETFGDLHPTHNT